MLHIHHLLTGYGESDAEYGSDDEFGRSHPLLQFSNVHLKYRFEGGARLVSRVYFYVIYGFSRALGLVEWLAFFSYSWAIFEAWDGFVMSLRLVLDCLCVSFYTGPTELSPTSRSFLSLADMEQIILIPQSPGGIV